MKVIIEFEENDPKQDFLNVMAGSNVQAFIDAIGLAGKEELITVTEQEKIDYVENIWSNTVVETYKAEKVRQEAEAYAASRKTTVDNSISASNKPIKREKS